MRKFIVHLRSIIVASYPMLLLTMFLTIPGGLYAQNVEINISKGWEGGSASTLVACRVYAQ